MPRRATQQQMLYAYLIVIIIFLILSLDNENELDVGTDNWMLNIPSQAIGNIPAINVHYSIYNSVFFKHYTGVHENLYDYLFNRLNQRLYEARNVTFKFDEIFNKTRKKKKM